MKVAFVFFIALFSQIVTLADSVSSNSPEHNMTADPIKKALVPGQAERPPFDGGSSYYHC